MTALDDIVAERRRQIEVEGFDARHDDNWPDGTLALAAATYALPDKELRSFHGSGARLWVVLWPWDAEWFKRRTRRRDLVKAAALIVAEIERLDRLAAGQGGAPMPGERMTWRMKATQRDVLSVFADGRWHNTMSPTFLDEQPIRRMFAVGVAVAAGWLEQDDADEDTAFWCRITAAGRAALAAEAGHGG